MPFDSDTAAYLRAEYSVNAGGIRVKIKKLAAPVSAAAVEIDFAGR